MSQDQLSLFNPKKINLPYTVAVFKPDIVLKSDIVRDLLAKIENEGFIIKQMFQRLLTKQEISNLFYKHTNKPFFEDILDYMLSGETLIILLCHETQNPITKWKKMIGHYDPVEAKVNHT